MASNLSPAENDSSVRPTHPLDTPERSAGTIFDACLGLEDNKVPYVIWFEHALSYHGVRTAVFDLYILVSDINMAAQSLAQAGWTIDTQSPHRIGNDKVQAPQVRLIPPNKDREMKTVLLNASDWKFPLTADTLLQRALTREVPDRELSFPPLPGLLDALVESWFDNPDGQNDGLQLHLAVQFGYLYEYVPALKVRSFAEQMKYEHRQFHFDVLSGMQFGTIPFKNHELPIRDALRQETYQLRDCSASREENIRLFDAFAGVCIPDPPVDQSIEYQ